MVATPTTMSLDRLEIYKLLFICIRFAVDLKIDAHLTVFLSFLNKNRCSRQYKEISVSFELFNKHESCRLPYQ
jgi:hypothetical protein